MSANENVEASDGGLAAFRRKRYARELRSLQDGGGGPFRVRRKRLSSSLSAPGGSSVRQARKKSWCQTAVLTGVAGAGKLEGGWPWARTTLVAGRRQSRSQDTERNSVYKQRLEAEGAP